MGRREGGGGRGREGEGGEREGEGGGVLALIQLIT